MSRTVNKQPDRSYAELSFKAQLETEANTCLCKRVITDHGVYDRRESGPPSLKDALGKGDLTRDEAADWLRTMAEIRYFEDKVSDLLAQDVIKGASHLYAGQEAVAVGAIAAIERGDVIASTHRGHGHCGAIGNKYCDSEEERQEHWNKMMAELMGREDGYCSGRGGSMHIADVEKCNNLGSTGIVGGNQPPAVGAALAEKLKKSRRVTLSFFGDGACNTGTFHESLNMASTFGLPLVAIIENNLYGMSVPFFMSDVPCAGRAANVQDIAIRANAYNVPGMIVDGQDPLAMFYAVREAVKRAREDALMTLIEAKTYRWYGHSRSDPRKYRTKEEEKEWRDRDPLTVWSRKMVEEAGFKQEECDAILAKAGDTIEKATAFAMDSPWPDPRDVTKDVYVTVPRDPAAETAEAELGRKVDAAQKSYDEAMAARGKRTIREVRSEVEERLRKEYNMTLMTIAQAVCAAHRAEMAADPNVIVFGEDVGLYGGAYKATNGLLDEFGPERVFDAPISEAAIAGAAVGAALRGLKPVAEIMYVDFLTIAMDQLVHNGAYNRYMFGGKTHVPMVLRTEGGVGRSIACHHSESLESWMVHAPGLTVVMPSTPYDALGLLRSSIQDPNPIVFIEHKATYGQVGPVPLDDYTIPLRTGRILRSGKDVTIAAYSRMAMFALDAAKELAAQGVDAEVIDPRTLKPLDARLIAESVKKTGRLVTVSEAFPHCGMGREIASEVMDYRFDDGYLGFDYLDAPPMNVTSQDAPPPMSAPLEDVFAPSVGKIVETAKKLVAKQF
jgi:pyruvate/2-oxoglutarate/acetoin dehydrogenase E1 component/TPP-dependent pyruvate/acetoin dehydrogenase alpha subunit